MGLFLDRALEVIGFYCGFGLGAMVGLVMD